MAEFLKEYQLPDWARDDLQLAWQRISAPQSKQLLWDEKLRHTPALGATLDECLQKRDIVAAWIVANRPHPSPPLAIVDMAQLLKILSPTDAANLKRVFPPEALQPFTVPASQEL